VSGLLALVLGAGFVVAGGLTAFVLANGETRRALRLAMARKHRWFAPRIIVAGDSLASGCSFRPLSGRPFGVLSVAKGGATLREIAVQLADVQAIEAKWIVIDGGLNDLLTDDANIAQIERDFRLLLRRINPARKAIFTLMPHVADPAWAARINSVNERVAELCAQRGVVALDLNPELSLNGVRRPEMTDDGLHFTSRANAAWVEATRRLMIETSRC
jgi:hypothetical protein